MQKLIQFRGLVTDFSPFDIDDSSAQESFNFDYTQGGMRPNYTRPTGSGNVSAEYGRRETGSEHNLYWNRYQWQGIGAQEIQYLRRIVTETSRQTVIGETGYLITEPSVSEDSGSLDAQFNGTLPLDMADNVFNIGPPQGNVKLFKHISNLYYYNGTQMGRITGDSPDSFRAIIITDDLGIKASGMAQLPGNPFSTVFIGASSGGILGVFAFNGTSFTHLSQGTVNDFIVSNFDVSDNVVKVLSNDRDCVFRTRAPASYTYPDLTFGKSIRTGLEGSGLNLARINSWLRSRPTLYLKYHTVESQRAGKNIWSLHSEDMIGATFAVWRSGRGILGFPTVEKQVQYVEIITESTASGSMALQGFVDGSDTPTEEYAFTFGATSNGDGTIHKIAFNKLVGKFIDFRFIVPGNEGLQFQYMNVVFDGVDQKLKYDTYR